MALSRGPAPRAVAFEGTLGTTGTRAVLFAAAFFKVVAAVTTAVPFVTAFADGVTCVGTLVGVTAGPTVDRRLPAAPQVPIYTFGLYSCLVTCLNQILAASLRSSISECCSIPVVAFLSLTLTRHTSGPDTSISPTHTFVSGKKCLPVKVTASPNCELASGDMSSTNGKG